MIRPGNGTAAAVDHGPAAGSAARTDTPLRVLYVAPVEPWGRENGSSVITADLLEGLAQQPGLDCLPVFLRRPPPGYTARPARGLEGVGLDLHGLPRWLSVARAIATGSSPMHVRFDNRAVAATVAAVAAERGFVPDLVHVEHLPLVDIGHRLADRFDCPVVYRSHNIESNLWARRLGRQDALTRLATRRLGMLEARAMESCALSFCISQVDLAWARTHAPAANLDLLPCTLLMKRYEEVEPAHGGDRPRLCFVGGLEWAPNEAGLRWFVDAVLPGVKARVPDVRVTILARGAAERPWLVEEEAVEILPETAEALPLFASSRVSIAPLLQGGGVRIKIPESLSVGCSVVATRVGAEGLDLPGLTRTDDPEAFAEACAGYLRQRRGEQERAELRAAVSEFHGAVPLARRLVERWTATVRDAAGASRPTV